jgi:ribosomal protein L31
MKKKIHFPLHKIIFHCISCNQDFQTFSISLKNVRIGSCRSCNPFYTGAAASEVKVGEVEKFRQRAQKVKEKTNKC